MKPKDLKPVFADGGPKILVEDNIWYIPKWGEKDKSFQFKGFSSDQFFNNDKPVYIEYCSGNGTWIAQKADTIKEVNWLAVEMKWKRIRKIWSKIQNLDLLNLIGVCGEGFNLTKDYIPDSSIDGIYINFPDPWPKKKHAKNRLINPLFIDEMGRILKKGAMVVVATDDLTYSESLLKDFLNASCFEPVDPDPYYINELEGYGSSYFENLWRGLGREIRYHRFRAISP